MTIKLPIMNKNVGTSPNIKKVNPIPKIGNKAIAEPHENAVLRISELYNKISNPKKVIPEFQFPGRTEACFRIFDCLQETL